MNDLTANDVKWAKQHDWFISSRLRRSDDIMIIVIVTRCDHCVDDVELITSNEALHDFAGY